MEKTILITGINGFLGSNLAKILSKDHQIIGLEYSLENLYRLKGFDFKIYSSKGVSLEKIFSENKIEIIIHTATVYRTKGDSINNLLTSNINFPIKLFELAELNGINAFLNTDSFFNNPEYDYSYLGEYTLSKRHCLDWLKILQKKTKLINMKLFHMYGPDDSSQKFVPQIINQLKNNVEKLELTEGVQKRDFIYISDVVNAFKCVIDNLNNIKNEIIEFEVGSGNPISIREFVEITANITQSKTNLHFGKLPLRDGEIMFSKADTTSLNNLGWSVKTSLKQGIKNIC
jgi:nucleoside-diphosphate-sugar epimerase